MANEEWKARQRVLNSVAVIISTVNFDSNGLCTDKGEHNRCNLAAIYFDLRADSGEGETLHDDKKVYTVFVPSEIENQVLGLGHGAPVGTFQFVVTREKGVAMGREILLEDVEVLRKQCHSDNPDDEVEDEPSPSAGNDGEISF